MLNHEICLQIDLDQDMKIKRKKHNVLILTQSRKDLPVDVQGMLVEHFNIDDPYNDIYTKVKKLVKRYK